MKPLPQPETQPLPKSLLCPFWNTVSPLLFVTVTATDGLDVETGTRPKLTRFGDADSVEAAEHRFALAALERLPADPQAADMFRKLLRKASPTTLRRVQ